MNEKPQETREGGQEDLLEQIITRGLNDTNVSAQVNASQEAPADEASFAPERDDSVDAAPSAARKNRRSAVYLYLLILFGAAFLMLLLAYFIQQRSNETTISDLRNSMNLSREELMDEIRDLEKKNSALEAAVHSSETDRALQEQEIEALQNQVEGLTQNMLWVYGEKLQSDTLNWLERFCAEEDWLLAAVIVQESDSYMNERNRDYGQTSYWSMGSESFPGLAPVQARRYLELREQVFDNAGCMVMESWTSGPEDQNYAERPYIAPSTSRYDEDTVNTALSLWQVFCHYSQHNNISGASSDIAAIYNDGEAVDRLNSSAFRPSTVQLFHDIVDEYLVNGALVQKEDGTLSVSTFYLPTIGPSLEQPGSD